MLITPKLNSCKMFSLYMYIVNVLIGIFYDATKILLWQEMYRKKSTISW